ncbi:DGQHR domain-containing protein [Sulfuricella denitrificans skB26]|uniref:DGQHR domain-containing protein n=1 Tax=Sulfuricella denitrificans (strain DSM 22764 / NBRC 105220 / skB26) TaxID=1163617 RepID=S6B2K8_SULDS|nr:DGQHR domain-containing protein [Sulfuricella denitrificans]BAN34912.1 DGQHR domain-containing protein [Sulfuricella denitrificans skB26]
MNISSASLDQITTDILQRESQEKHALSLLLDRYTASKDKIFVQKTEMGGTESYIGAVTLEWLAERVRFASQLPLFREKIDPVTKSIEIDKDTINEILQRPLDYSRQAVLAQYLAARPKHKFPPLLVVVSQEWVDNQDADEWNSDGHAIKSTSDFSALDSMGKYGLLDVSEGIQIFALDGQHRLLGVQGLMELIKTGRLSVRKRNGDDVKNQVITSELLEERYGVTQSKLQQLGKEIIGIEFISAVVPGESRAEAKRRIRTIFVHVNRMAAPLTAGQIHQLDEDNGFALVAKRVTTSHPFLSAIGEGRVNWENNTISSRSTSFTTLQALTEMAKGVLEPIYPTWSPSEKGLIQLRPEDPELEDGVKRFTEFMDYLVELPSIKRAAQGTPSPQLRNFSAEGGEGILLYRPVGQTALASAVGLLMNEGVSIKQIFEKLSAYDEKGGFSKIDHFSSLWYGVLFDPNKQRMLVSGENLAKHLLVYLLKGGLPDEREREDLRMSFAEAREIDGQFRKFDGEWGGNKDIQLPNPL